MMTRWFMVVIFIIGLLCARQAFAQQIALEQGVRANGLWCFPIATDRRQYVYLPNVSQLGRDEAGKPQFSFVRYVLNQGGESDGASAITNAGGGGILHFLVLYETPQSVIAGAQQALRRDSADDSITLRGPIVFQSGRYTLVSSIVGTATSSPERHVLAIGNAPVVEGNRIALSFDLGPKEANLLMQSFAMNTPDISLVFDMTFQGLTEAYDAELTIDWAEVHKTEGFNAGGSVYFVSAQVEKMMDELRRNHAIRLRSSGSDSAMEALLTNVYNKLLELMFRRVEPERVPAEQRGGLIDALAALTNSRAGPLSSSKTTGFGAHVGYQLKEMKSEGSSVLNFNHRATVERHSFITFNIGDFYRRFGSDQSYFRTVNIGDAAFQQREVQVALDGALLSDFDRQINNVSVTLRKVHQSGQETVRELVLDREKLNGPAKPLRLIYGWDHDDNRLAWLNYDYRTRWSFKGGGTYQTPWTTTDAPMIDLFAPYLRHTVQITGNYDTLKSKGVRAVIVQLEYSFFGERRRSQPIVIRPDRVVEEPKVEITLPQNHFDTDYTITWQFNDGRSVTTRGRDVSGLIFIDEISENRPSSGATLLPVMNPVSFQPITISHAKDVTP
jgi:hypothetical protein